MSKAVMTVIFGLLDNRRSYKKGDNCSVCAIKALVCKKVGIQALPLHLGTTENTSLAIGGFLAGIYRSLLTFLFVFLGFTDNP